MDTQPGGELGGDGAVGTALISGETFTDRPVQFTNRDGVAYFEGDIILGRVEDLTVLTDEARARARDASQGLHQGVRPGARIRNVDQPQDDGPAHAVIIPGGNFRWAAGRVPFTRDGSLGASASASLTSAITHWHNQTRLAFVPRASQPDWLNCRGSGECSSQVGRRGGVQDVNLSDGCGFGATVHELGHAVGLWHEQSREDRDQFVSITWANIQAGKAHNFDQHISDGDDVGCYDYGSIMHYGSTAFGTTDPATGRTNITITPTRPLPPGVILGQRGGLSVGDRAAVAQMYPTVYPTPANTWVGRFEGGTADRLLYYSPARHIWYLGRGTAAGVLTFVEVGDTTGFGDLDDGRPIWVGDFTGNGTTDVLFYYPGDDNWWLGELAGGQLTWSLVGNTVGFGHAINDGRPFWVGDFTGNGSADVLFYSPGDRNWWLGQVGNGQLTWSLVGNTAGFGNVADGRPFWVGDFTGGGGTDLLFYYPGDDNWWLGSMGAVAPENAQCPNLRSEIARHRAEIRGLQELKRGLNPRDPADRAEIAEINREIAVHNRAIGSARGQMAQLGCQESPNAGGQQLTWQLAGNTIGFGHAINDGRSFWAGDLTGNGSTDVLFHYRGDLNWWLGQVSGGSLAWTLAGTW
ncbi:MAG: M12 family metallopeptidase [Kineosporiaceae bacterium]